MFKPGDRVFLNTRINEFLPLLYKIAGKEHVVERQCLTHVWIEGCEIGINECYFELIKSKEDMDKKDPILRKIVYTRPNSDEVYDTEEEALAVHYQIEFNLLTQYRYEPNFPTVVDNLDKIMSLLAEIKNNKVRIQNAFR